MEKVARGDGRQKKKQKKQWLRAEIKRSGEEGQWQRESVDTRTVQGRNERDGGGERVLGNCLFCVFLFLYQIVVLLLVSVTVFLGSGHGPVQEALELAISISKADMTFLEHCKQRSRERVLLWTRLKSCGRRCL